MKPDKEGIWEWFEADGTRRLVSVCDVEHGVYEPEWRWLRVYWWGGYYNVHDDPNNPGPFGKREWPDRWGNYIGPEGCVPEEQLYLGPTPEQREKIMKQREGH